MANGLKTKKVGSRGKWTGFDCFPTADGDARWRWTGSGEVPVRGRLPYSTALLQSLCARRLKAMRLPRRLSLPGISLSAAPLPQHATCGRRELGAGSATVYTSLDPTGEMSFYMP